MRFTLAIVMATLALGIVTQPMRGQLPTNDAPVLEAIHMVDMQTGWAVTDRHSVGTCGREGCLLRTTDGGIRWTDVTPLASSGRKIRVLRIRVLSSLTAWVVTVDSTSSAASETFRTADGGRTWRRMPVPAAGVISFINSREGWLLVSGGAFAGSEIVDIFQSTDGGETWIKVASATPENQSSGLPFVGDKSSITFLNSTTGWLTGVTLQYDTLYLYVTHDGGRTWRQQDIPLPRELAPHWRGSPLSPPPKFFTARDGVLPVFYEIYEGPDDALHQAGKVAVIYVTHDGGTTWAYTLVKRVNDFYPSSFADTNHGWVMDGDALHVTRDGGRRWTAIRLWTSPANRLPVDVTQLDFVSPRIGWAIRPKSPSLYKTLDGGRTWSPVAYTIVRQ